MKMNNIRKSRWSKNLSLLLALNFLMFMFNPTASYALAGGPGQPELEGFSPIGMDNMVDLFTGDFSYNLPLLNVPGPDGGYPINLSYSAGIDMEQEASWVGLGWSLNPGAINREVRGLPDDFNGEKIKKELSQKPNRTIAVNVPFKAAEIFGADLAKIKKKYTAADTISPISSLDMNINLIYNNYKGFDIQVGMGFSKILAEENAASSDRFANVNSITDLSAYSSARSKINFRHSLADFFQKNRSFGQATRSIFSSTLGNKDYYKKLGIRALDHGANGFASGQSVSNITVDYPRSSFSSRFNGKLGSTYFGKTKDVEIEVFFSTEKPKTPFMELSSYGYLYTENKYEGDGSYLSDFVKDNKSAITPDSKILPMPISTNDVFHVKAQGLSGTVRAYKGGVTYLSEPNFNNSNTGGGANAEFNTLDQFLSPPPPPAITATYSEKKFGAGVKITNTTSYSGDWKNGNKSFRFLQDVGKVEKRQQQPLVEPYYFSFKNEMTEEVNKSSLISDENALNLDLGTAFAGLSVKPIAKNKVQGSTLTTDIDNDNAFLRERTKRVKSFTILTEKEASTFFGFTRQVYKHGTSTLENIPGSSESKIGAITVTNENGSRYIYGIPAVNKKHKEATFSIQGKDPRNASQISKLAAYTSSDNSTSNEKGLDEFYSATTTPEHAHSYLLTEIVSPDYVDIERDGPTPDDLGNYTAFEYSRIQNFRSQTPVATPGTLRTHYIPGQLANNGDDKGSINYYEKDIYFLKAIKTKTHIAVFETSDRHDARGIIGENNSNLSTLKMQQLDKITLYNRADYEDPNITAQPIKTVNFEYSYELCKGVPNNANTNGGKLTLKKVWYTVGDNRTQMSLSPYLFTYANNPDYNTEYTNRWGTYQTHAQNKYGSNVLYPYATASQEDADANAAAWNLSKIQLPTGGEINITYEADDYRFVQNKPAQNMYKILGFSSTYSGSSYNQSLDGNNLYMIVQLDKTIDAPRVSEYLEGIDQAYYKAFIKYKDYESSKTEMHSNGIFNDNDDAYDFVNGYLDLTSEKHLFDADGEGFSDKIAIKINRQANMHPIRLAGLLDLKLNRNYLVDDSSIDLSGVHNLGSKIIGFLQSIVGKAFQHASEDPFIAKGITLGWCNTMSQDLFSIIRLNTVDDKIGGGHRVKKITISDGWSNMGGNSSTAQTYGQEYLYDLETNRSSGVASYEPMAGGEENPMRQAVRYSNDRLIFKDDYLHTELPIGESLYPSPVVGYSKVVVKNLANQQSTIAGAGIQQHEFYTAKDYPVIEKHTDIERVGSTATNKVLTFMGVKDYFMPGFSQGFTIQTNDMHGKQKASATYAAHANLSEDSPRQKVQYFYKTKGGYNDNQINELDNKTNIFKGDGNSVIGTLGVEKDAAIYFNESSVLTIGGGLDYNMTTGLITAVLPGAPLPIIGIFPIVLVPTITPDIDYDYRLTRITTITKTINKTAILEKVIATQDGAQTITENLGYDAEIGSPILTSVTNEYEGKTYDYRQPAHWHYDQAKGAYNNIGLTLYGDAEDYQAYLQNGDVLVKDASIVWMHDIDNKIAKDVNGNTVALSALDNYKVVRSGYRNQQALQIGAIQSMTNPINGLQSNLSFLKHYNTAKPFPMPLTDVTFNFNDCELGQINTSVDFFEGTLNSIGGGAIGSAAERLRFQNEFGTDSIYAIRWTHGSQQNPYWDCFVAENGTDIIYFIIPITDDTRDNFGSFDLHYIGNGELIADNGLIQIKGYISTTPSLYAPTAADCFGKCWEGVLNASATTLTDDLKSDQELPGNLTTTDIAANPYRYAYKGLLKTKEQKFYPQLRKQTDVNGYYHNTRINEDGEYDEFFGYKWNLTSSTSNPNWKTASEVTQYDYNGNPIEEKDAIGNYSTVLFGYERTLPIAVAGNSKYQNIAYDSYEDYNPNATFTEKPGRHLHFTSGASIATVGHTGKQCLQLSAATTTSKVLKLEAGKYIAYAWQRVGGLYPGTMQYTDGTNPPTAAEVISPNIEGWQLLRLDFTANGTTDQIQLTGNGEMYDDIRIQPFNSSMKCFVYDPETQKTLAVLDENHFATLYNYDRDQVLIQVKKETERGIKTIQSTHRHTTDITSNASN